MKVNVGVGELVVSADAEDVLVASALGSCIGLAVFDKEARVGGLVHCKLPMSTMNPEMAKDQPGAFCDTGVHTLLQSVFDLGATRTQLVAKVAGGASILDEKGIFRIGERNLLVVRKVLWKNDVLIASADVGGTKPRTITLEIGTGKTVIKSGGEKYWI